MRTLSVLADLPIYCTHEQWEHDHPADLEHAQSLAAASQRVGQAPTRRFPCLGALRQVNAAARPQLLLLACDQCSFETSVRRAPVTHADAFIDSAAAHPDDEWAF